MGECRKEGTFEKPVTTFNGMAMLLLLIALVAVGIALVFMFRNPRLAAAFFFGAGFIAPGFFMPQPNEAAMVSNLMVVSCSERDTQPIVNTGTLYT